MKPILALLLAALSSSSALACQTPTPESLRAAWITWRAAALKDEPGTSARLYKFPFLLLSAYQGDRPLRVTKAGFNDNYVDLFGLEVQFREDLKKTTDNEHIEKINFDDQACKLKFTVRVHDTNFTYDQKAGWLVQSIYMPGAYSIFNKGDTQGIR